MAEGFEPYHVPQQSRRDKLRVCQQECVDNNLLGCQTLAPLYDPSLISTDLISCTNQSFSLEPQTSAGVKEEGMNLMGFVGGMNMIASSSCSSAATSHLFVDPQLSVQVNPTTIQDINGTPFAYYRGIIDQSFQENGVVVYKPEANSNCLATTGQSLSLSLSSHHTHHNNLPRELNLQRYDSTMLGANKVSGGGYFLAGNGGSTSTQLSMNSVPLGPFTGYASVLKGSRFLKPAHQLLEELCDVGRGIGILADKTSFHSFLLEPSLESLSGNGVEDESLNCSDGGEPNRKKSRLLSMLDEVYKRYKQYYQQMHAVFTSFESVAGLSSAAPFANLAIKAVSKHFRFLKNAITDHLHFVSKAHGKLNYQRDETQRPENLGRGNYDERPFHIDPPVWRPQRGLPERAVTVLRAWLFEHFLHPYPTDTDKLMLAKQTGLSRNQVSNWFINARVRLWKPMVEEIHMLETRESQKTSQREDFTSTRTNSHLPTSCSIECENTSSSVPRDSDTSLKRTRKDFTEMERPMNLPFNKLSNHPHLGMGASNAGSSGGVSLTLGLHQNSMGIPPITAARRLGLDMQGEGLPMGGYAAHGREFARDMIGGQILQYFPETNR